MNTTIFSKRKYNALLISIVVFACYTFPIIAFGNQTTVTLNNPLSAAGINNLCQLLNAILNIVAEVGALIAVLFFIWSGFLFVKAQGNKVKLDAAKKALYSTIIGTAILVGGSLITKVLVDTIGQVTSSVGGTASSGICTSSTSSTAQQQTTTTQGNDSSECAQGDTTSLCNQGNGVCDGKGNCSD